MRQPAFNSVPPCLCGEPLLGSWSPCAIRESWRLPMNRASVAAGVPPAVEGGVSPPGIPGSRAVSRSISNRRLSMNLPSPRHRTPTPHRNPPASPGSWPVSMAPAPTPLPMNRASVAAGVPPAVEGGVSPPGIPGSWSAGRSISNRGFSMQAIARIEPGSLTPALSRRERVSRPALSDTPEPRPSVPSRIAPACARLNPPKPAAHLLLLPPGEGRDEGRPLHASRNGSWSQDVSRFWRTFLPMNLPSIAAAVPPCGIPVAQR